MQLTGCALCGMEEKSQKCPYAASCRVSRYGAHILSSVGMQKSAQFMQHGATSVRDHCMNVACCATKMARVLRLKVNEQDLVHAALLHDYFLYDWHDRSASRPRHATQHPRYAAENAIRDFEISQEAVRAIHSHMFPMSRHIPQGSLGWLVCIADKLCTAQEVAQGILYRVRPRLG